MEIKQIQRDSNGLIVGLDYVQDASGRIDWRKMIKPQYLVPNRQVFERQNKEVPTSIEGLEDRELLILLGGIKDLADVRGYNSFNFTVDAVCPDFVTVACHMQWFPNFETEGVLKVTGGTADAHPGNTDGFGRSFLTAIAENRSFVRCVRNFLRINIVGQDEISPKEEVVKEEPSPITSPNVVLEKLMNDKSVSFEDLRVKLLAEAVKGAENFKSIKDIPRMKMFELIDRLQKVQKPK